MERLQAWLKVLWKDFWYLSKYTVEEAVAITRRELYEEFKADYDWDRLTFETNHPMYPRSYIITIPANQPKEPPLVIRFRHHDGTAEVDHIKFFPEREIFPPK